MTPHPKSLKEAEAAYALKEAEATQIRIAYDDDRVQLFKAEEVRAATLAIGNRARRRKLAAKLRTKGRP